MNHPAIALLMYFILYFSLAFIWRSVAVYRATGIQPILLPDSDDAPGYVGRMFKILLVLCLLHLQLQTMGAQANAWWPSIDPLDQAWLHSLGWIVLALSTLMLLLAQVQMGHSWRIGLDANAPGSLVTQGLFSRSRNPIFLSMRMSLLGQLAVLPNMMTLMLLVCGELLIQIQVRLEEVHLQHIYGDAYASYRAHVPRWW
jgi:protein-S-isoprenylcysteine O-methyltransferase Ste14